MGGRGFKIAKGEDDWFTAKTSLIMLSSNR